MIQFAITSEVGRISRFGLIGVFNTLVDFTIFNALSGKAIGFSKIWANTISTTIAMVISFVLNRSYVFGSHGSELHQAILFFAVTAFGLYVLQNGVIYLFTSYWAWPARLVNQLVSTLHIPLETDFVLKNGAKACGVVVSLTWNYILYGRIVFHG